MCVFFFSEFLVVSEKEHFLSFSVFFCACVVLCLFCVPGWWERRFREHLALYSCYMSE